MPATGPVSPEFLACCLEPMVEDVEEAVLEIVEALDGALEGMVVLEAMEEVDTVELIV